MPARDPQSWILEGSADGKAWQELDRRELGKPFEKRFQARTFEIAKPQACRFYRFTFAPRNASHFQVAEIELAGAPIADRRRLRSRRLPARTRPRDRHPHDHLHPGTA